MDIQDKKLSAILAKLAAESAQHTAASKSIYGLKQRAGVNTTFMAPKRLAEELGISVKTLERMRKDGSGPPYIHFGTKFIRYPIVTLETWITALLTKHGEITISTNQQEG